jgi:capsule polysaccharide export protein KpsE/RkpR
MGILHLSYHRFVLQSITKFEHQIQQFRSYLPSRDPRIQTQKMIRGLRSEFLGQMQKISNGKVILMGHQISSWLKALPGDGISS